MPHVLVVNVRANPPFPPCWCPNEMTTWRTRLLRQVRKDRPPAEKPRRDMKAGSGFHKTHQEMVTEPAVTGSFGAFEAHHEAHQSRVSTLQPTAIVSGLSGSVWWVVCCLLVLDMTKQGARRPAPAAGRQTPWPTHITHSMCYSSSHTGHTHSQACWTVLSHAL